MKCWIIILVLLTSTRAQSTQKDACLSNNEQSSMECELLKMRNTIEQQAAINRELYAILDQQNQKLNLVIYGARDCEDLLQLGHVTSGVYDMYTANYSSDRYKRIYCDMATDGGGWTVIQRRFDGSEDFRRSWDEFKHGFGNVSGEHWLGNEYLYQLTSRKNYTVRFDLEDWSGETRYAVYSSFSVASELDKYRLGIGEYSGTAGDSGSGFSYHDDQQFSTWDDSNDNRQADGRTCIERFQYGGFWFNNCMKVGINNHYSHSSNGYGGSSYDRIRWDAWHGSQYSLKTTKMMMRPVN